MRTWFALPILCLGLALSACADDRTERQNASSISSLTGEPPILIAHRGASGERPEHTLAAYQLAIDQGADFIEPDLVLTRDGILVARHENEISETTDIADRPEYGDRRTSKMIDGREYSGWFTEDFTLAELKTLRARERLPDLRAANRQYDGRFEIPTFEEILKLLRQYERETGKRVGVYPETKHPSYFDGIGLSHDQPMLELLQQYGFATAGDPVFIQSFEVANLQRLAKLTDIRLVQLIAEEGGPADDPALRYEEMITPAGLSAIARYADGIGPAKSLVIARDSIGRLGEPTGLVQSAHAADLVVHPWTFRRENYFLPTDFVSGVSPAAAGDLAGEVKKFVAAGVDGLFSDNVAEARAELPPKTSGQR